MPWLLTEHPDLPIIETCFRGSMPPEEVKAAVAGTVAAVARTGRLRVLSDCRELTGGHSLFDLYALVGDLGGMIPKNFREAVLMPTQDLSAEMVSFWETASMNRGINVRNFRDRAEALAWLAEPDLP